MFVSIFDSKFNISDVDNIIDVDTFYLYLWLSLSIKNETLIEIDVFNLSIAWEYIM